MKETALKLSLITKKMRIDNIFLIKKGRKNATKRKGSNESHLSS